MTRKHVCSKNASGIHTSNKFRTPGHFILFPIVQVKYENIITNIIPSGHFFITCFLRLPPSPQIGSLDKKNHTLTFSHEFKDAIPLLKLVKISFSHILIMPIFSNEWYDSLAKSIHLIHKHFFSNFLKIWVGQSWKTTNKNGLTGFILLKSIYNKENSRPMVNDEE